MFSRDIKVIDAVFSQLNTERSHIVQYIYIYRCDVEEFSWAAIYVSE